MCETEVYGEKLSLGSIKSRTTQLLWTVVFEEKLQPCLKLRNFQNLFCHILETLNKNYQKTCTDMFIQFRFIVSQILKKVIKSRPSYAGIS